MRKEIKSIHQRIRVTTVYVTHDQTDVMTMVDRIVVMRNGVVEQIAGPLELYDNPANQFVAGFIGSPPMNFIPGVLSGDASQCVFSQSEASVPLDVRLDDGQSGPVIYGIRPEHLRINEQNGRPARVNCRADGGGYTDLCRNRRPRGRHPPARANECVAWRHYSHFAAARQITRFRTEQQAPSEPAQWGLILESGRQTPTKDGPSDITTSATVLD